LVDLLVQKEGLSQREDRYYDRRPRMAKSKIALGREERRLEKIQWKI